MKKDYKVGVWYDFSKTKDKRRRFAKFKKLSENGIYFHFTEYIYLNEKHMVYNGNWNNESAIVEADMAEIYQYIPCPADTIIETYEIY